MNDDGVGQPPQARMEAEATGQGRVYQALNQYFYNQAGQIRSAVAMVVAVPPLTGVGLSRFVGRTRQVSGLLDQLDPADVGPVATVVSAVSGMGGIGKTALVEHVAGIAVGRDWFPGGTVMVDLRGYHEVRIGAGQVFASALRLLGVDGAQVPAEVDEQAAVYHHLLARLAEAGRRVLLVLDNASTTDQVEPLLPRSSAHRVLVTSRHTLGDLDGVRVLNLDLLPEADAVALLAQSLRERDPCDQRVADHRGDAVEVVRLCGLLPLAVRIAGAILADDPDMHLGELVAELDDAHTRLGVLRYGQRDVAATFALSFRHLTDRDPDAARLFRLLPFNPGPEISAEATAALADQPTAVVRRLLRVLAQAHLIERGTATGRWRTHDLVRAYATGLPETDDGERAAAPRRLLRYYLATADAADDHLRALPGQQMPDRFTDRQDALDWFDTERPNLLAAITLAVDIGDHDTTINLATVLAEYLSWRRYLADWVTVATAARDATRHFNDRRREGGAWNNLGIALAEVRRFDEAIGALQTARDICQETGDRHREGMAWGNLGLALTEVRRFDEAIEALQTARDICQEIGDRHGEGTAWNNLGLALTEVRRFDEAITAHQTGRNIHQETGNRHGEGGAWGNLGAALREVRRFDEAIEALQTARDICQEIGDRHGEGTAWNNLGLALTEVRRFDEAITAHQNDLRICQEVGDRHREGMAWGNLGLALTEVRRFDEAITAHQTARDICQETGDRHREGMAWNNLGIALQQVRRFDEAITTHQTARNIYHEIGNRHGESGAWGNLGNALAEVRRFDEAITAHQTARDICQETGDRHREGMAWNNLGIALQQVRRFDEAITAYQQAIDRFTETGNIEAAEKCQHKINALHD